MRPTSVGAWHQIIIEINAPDCQMNHLPNPMQSKTEWKTSFNAIRCLGKFYFIT
jgi:hypothetical protein